jgi:hypothetical protein
MSGLSYAKTAVSPDANCTDGKSFSAKTETSLLYIG